MEQMRRRLFFVFSWLVAAVVTSVVASAAVAIAGGQVSDRPLRPLTAAEVEALASAPITRPTPTAAPDPTVTTLVIIALTLGLAPFVPEPHIWEKLKMLAAGDLTRPLDIFDLILHATPFAVLILKLIRMWQVGR